MNLLAPHDQVVVDNVRLAKACARRMRGYGYMDDDEIESRCMEGLLKAARLFDPERHTSFGGYACRVMQSCVQQEARLRRRKKRCATVVEFDPSLCGKVSEDFELIETKELVSRLLTTLDPFQRDVVQRRFWNGERLHEIAAHYHTTKATISRALTAILERLDTTARRMNAA